MSNQPDISYILSLYNRIDYLKVCAYALKMQTHTNFEVIVTDNTINNVQAKEHKDFIKSLNDSRFNYVRTNAINKVNDCYWSSEHGMGLASGQWLCFPCEDNYYPPEWGQRMLSTAALNQLDLVLCEYAIAGPDGPASGADHYLRIQMRSLSYPGYKPSFIVRASKFPGWINKPTINACSGVDRTTLIYMEQAGFKWGIARDLYYVHN